jgi:Spy/CpxP family protein refolding chaperone
VKRRCLRLAVMIVLLFASVAQAQQRDPALAELLLQLQNAPPTPPPPPGAPRSGGRGGGQRNSTPQNPANPDLLNDVRTIVAPIEIQATVGGNTTSTTGRTILASPATGAWWTNADITARLNLTEDQKTRIGRAFENNRQALATNKETLEKEELLLGRFLDSETIDRAGVTAQITKVVQARAELEKTNALMTLEMREVLTRVQWMQLQVRQSVNVNVGATVPGGRGGGRGGGQRGAAPAPNGGGPAAPRGQN